MAKKYRRIRCRRCRFLARAVRWKGDTWVCTKCQKIQRMEED